MTTFTGGGITLYRWAAMRMALRLHLDGLKSRHLQVAWPSIRTELGLPPARMTRRHVAHVLGLVEHKVAEAERNLKPGDITP